MRDDSRDQPPVGGLGAGGGGGTGAGFRPGAGPGRSGTYDFPGGRGWTGTLSRRGLVHSQSDIPNRNSTSCSIAPAATMALMFSVVPLKMLRT